MPLVEPVTSAVLPCNMIDPPKDELGCLKVHYRAAQARLDGQPLQIVSD
jgi:hypothetical protein